MRYRPVHPRADTAKKNRESRRGPDVVLPAVTPKAAPPARAPRISELAPTKKVSCCGGSSCARKQSCRSTDAADRKLAKVVASRARRGHRTKAKAGVRSLCSSPSKAVGVAISKANVRNMPPQPMRYARTGARVHIRVMLGGSTYWIRKKKRPAARPATPTCSGFRPMPPPFTFVKSHKGTTISKAVCRPQLAPYRTQMQKIIMRCSNAALFTNSSDGTLSATTSALGYNMKSSFFPSMTGGGRR
mmetsp:Transcript_8513/g.32052  ORF Transcript_8513/g.32052 Transcript_8513/m.32052 type:complete len:245 (+) Transcript_8513:1551-2285(+)